MKLGFIDVKTNDYDAYEVVSEISGQVANTEIIRMSAPEILKIPATAKKLFSESGVDVIVVFATATEDDLQAVSIAQEKTIDVEIYYGKYVYFAIAPSGGRQDEGAEILALATAEATGAPLPEQTNTETESTEQQTPSSIPAKDEATRVVDDVHKLF